MAFALGRLLGLNSQQIKPKELPQHVARIKNTMRTARAAVLAHQAAPTAETMATVTAQLDTLLVLLAGCKPGEIALVDIDFTDGKK